MVEKLTPVFLESWRNAGQSMFLNRACSFFMMAYYWHSAGKNENDRFQSKARFQLENTISLYCRSGS